MSQTTNIIINNNNKNILITDAIIHVKGIYIIVISGLDKVFVNNICLLMSNILKYTYLSYIDLDKIINNDKNYYNDILKKVEYFKNIKPQGFIISLSSLPEKYTMFDVKLHINLSINQTYFDNIKKKYNYSNELFIDYNNILKSNKINKYINIKLDSDLNQIKIQIFNTIITSIEKHYYGINYSKVLQNRNDKNINTNTKNNNSDTKNNNSDSTNSDSEYSGKKNSKYSDSDNSYSDNSDSDNSDSDNSDSDNSDSDNSDSDNSDSDNSDSKINSNTNTDTDNDNDTDTKINSETDTDTDNDNETDTDTKIDSDCNSNTEAELEFNENTYSELDEDLFINSDEDEDSD